jgi:hypothetical protein
MLFWFNADEAMAPKVLRDNREPRTEPGRLSLFVTDEEVTPGCGKQNVVHRGIILKVPFMYALLTFRDSSWSVTAEWVGFPLRQIGTKKNLTSRSL